MTHAGAVEFISKLRFRRGLGGGTKRAWCRQVEWNESANDCDDKVFDTVFGDGAFLQVTQ